MPDGPAPEPTRDGLPPMPPGPPHEERHLAEHAVLRDLVVGAAEGPVLPFALAGALALLGAAPGLVLLVGLAAAAAGALARGLTEALAARAAAQHYAAERAREEEESRLYPDRERWEVAAILHRYGVRGEVLRQSVEAIAADRRRWVDFMMRFELDLQEPDPRRADRAALLGGLGHFVAGLIPLLPFLALATAPALAVSALLTVLALLGLGWLRARGAGMAPAHGAVGAFAVGLAGSAAALIVATLLAR